MPLTVVAVVAGLGLTYQGHRQDEQNALLPQQPVVATLTDIRDDLSQPARLVMTWSHPAPIVAPVGGRVTAEPRPITAPMSTDELRGTPVIQIDGVDRIGTVFPFYRQIGWGTSGTDVQALHRLLATLGYEVNPESTRYSRATQRAISALRRAIGAPSGSIFEPGFTVFLPRVGTPDEWLVSYGQRIAPDDPMIGMGPRLDSARVDLEGEVGRRISLEEAGDVILTVDGRDVTVSGLEPTGPELTRLGTMIDGEAEEKLVQARALSPILGSSIPAEALMVSGDGQRTCLAVANGSDFDVLGVETSTTVRPAIRLGPAELIGSRVLLNPATSGVDGLRSRC